MEGQHKSMDDQQVVYELCHWAPEYVLGLAHRLINFFCWNCRKDIIGTAAYEHYLTCCPKFIEELEKNRRKDLDYVKQDGSDYLRTFGPSEEPQKTLLFPESKNDPKAIKEILSSDDFKETLEQTSQGFRGEWGLGEDSETP